MRRSVSQASSWVPTFGQGVKGVDACFTYIVKYVSTLNISIDRKLKRKTKGHWAKVCRSPISAAIPSPSNDGPNLA